MAVKNTPPADPIEADPIEADPGIAALQALGQSVAPLIPQDLVSAPAFRVIALRDFGDALTKRDYQIGDLVPWRDRARAEKYAARGFVRIED